MANAQSFLSAADTMYVSRQAISKTVSQLESELGVKLFIRSQTGVELTPAGTHFYPQARAILADFDRLEREMKALERKPQTKIHLCMATGVNTIFAPRVNAYAAEHSSEVEVEITTCRDSDCDFVLGNYRADAVLSFTPHNSRSTTTSVIMESPIVFLVNNGNKLSNDDVLELSWRRRVANFLLYTGGRDHSIWWPVITRPGDTCCSDIDYLFQLLREDRGVLPIPEALLPEKLDYAKMLQGRPQVEPCRIYCSMLRASYYDQTTYKQLDQIYEEVLQTP